MPTRPELTGSTAGGRDPTSPPAAVAATIIASWVTQKTTRPVARLATISPPRFSWADKLTTRTSKREEKAKAIVGKRGRELARVAASNRGEWAGSLRFML